MRPPQQEPTSELKLPNSARRSLVPLTDRRRPSNRKPLIDYPLSLYDSFVTIPVSRSLSTYNRSLSRYSVPVSTDIHRNSPVRSACMDGQSLSFMGQSLTFQVQRATFLRLSLTFRSQPDGFPRSIAHEVRSIGEEFEAI